MFETFSDPASKNPTTRFPLDDSDISSISQATIVSLSKTAPILHKFGTTRIVRIRHDLVVKAGIAVQICEAENMKFAAANSQIHLPKVHFAFEAPNGDARGRTSGYIVMDYIDGDTLSDIWPSLATDRKIRITEQVASIIQEMQSIQVLNPGPIGGGKCEGRLFTDYGAGPFENSNAMEAWFNHKLDVCKRFNQAPKDTPRFHFHEFVLTHQDISPRNIVITGDTDEIYLIDWAWAGAYPPAFEMTCLKFQNQFLDFNKMVMQLIVDHPKEVNQLCSIIYALTTASLA